MLALERRNLILEKLQAEKKVVVSELSQLYEVSEETIRRDLDKLEKEGSGDTEIIPFTYEGGIDAFIQNEVHPYAPDAFVKPGSEKVGYELSFTKYFYKPVQLRPMQEIIADLKALEKETDGMLAEILGGIQG